MMLDARPVFMYFIHPVWIAFVISCGATAAQGATPLVDAELGVSALRDAPPRVYHVRVFAAEPAGHNAKGQPTSYSFDHRDLGTLTVVTRSDASAPGRVELIDRLETDLGTRTVTRTSISELDGVLRPAAVSVRAEEQGHRAETRARWTRGRVEVDAPGDENDFRGRWPQGTLTLSALIRLAPLLPQAEGEAFAVPGFAELFAFQPVTPKGSAFELRREAREAIEIAPRSYACTRWRLDLGDAGRDVRLWIDREGVLRQFVVGSHLRATLGKPGSMKDDPILAELVGSIESRVR